MEKKFATAITNQKDGPKAAEELAGKLRASLGNSDCHLAFFFLSEGYTDKPPKEVVEAFRKKLNPQFLIGCNAIGVIGDERELEMEAGMSAMAMHLPGVDISSFNFSQSDLEYMTNPKDLLNYLEIYPNELPKFVSIADPLSCDGSRMLSLFNAAYPQAPLIGGLASGNILGAENWIALDGEMLQSGSAGLVLHGGINLETCVSQGCRPIGEPLAVTKGENNVLHELGGRSALEAFREIYRTLSIEDQMLAQTSLFVGLAMDENQQVYQRGDFVIRNITGVDQASGALSIGALLEQGQTLQFQLRDAKTSEEDLEHLLEKMGRLEARSKGALLVSCCGRGRGLFGEEDHDIRIIQKKIGPLPVTGFFANGEFGPVKASNYIHGYTSSLSIFH